MTKRKQVFSTKKLTVAALLLAMGVFLPQVFHIGGPTTGSVFLPMHLSVYIGGMLLGPIYGMCVGVITPIISFFFTGMPPIAKLPFMIIELLSYGLLAGFLNYKRVNIYINLIAAQLGGRLIYGLTLFVGGRLLHLNVPAVATIGTAFITGIPGIIMQIVLVPVIVIALRKVVHFEREYAAS